MGTGIAMLSMQFHLMKTYPLNITQYLLCSVVCAEDFSMFVPQRVAMISRVS